MFQVTQALALALALGVVLTEGVPAPPVYAPDYYVMIYKKRLRVAKINCGNL